MVKTTTIEEIMVEYTKQNSKKKQPQKHQQQQQKKQEQSYERFTLDNNLWVLCENFCKVYIIHGYGRAR